MALGNRLKSQVEERDVGGLAENVDEHRTDHYLRLSSLKRSQDLSYVIDI